MEQFYQSMLAYVNQHTFLKNCIIKINHYFPYITFMLYPCVLIDLWLIKSPYLLDALFRPLCAFLFVSVFRKVIDRPRPYEHMNIQALVGHKKGESFPSRHTLSAFIIALVCFYVHLYLGIFALIIASIIALGRILAGVHHISDVIAGIVIALFFYLV